MRKLKFLLVLVLICTVVFTTVGCNTDADDGKIVIWHDKEDGVIAVLEDAVEQAQLDFEVEFVRKESLTDTLKLVGNDASSAPEMFIFAHDKVGLFSEIGILEPIENVVEEGTFDDFLPITLEAGTYKGVQYQMPLYFETLLFMYNKDLMNDSEVPATTEQLLTYMKDNTNKNAKQYGFVEQHSTAYYSVAWIQGFGGKVLLDDGTPNINSQPVIDALTYHKQFLQYMPGEGEYSTINTLFLEGMAHSIIGGPWLVPTAREAGINLGFADMPTLENGDSLAPFLGVQGAHVLKHAVQSSSQKAKVQTLLKLFSNAEISTNLALASGCAPSQQACYNDSRITNDEMVMKMRDTAINSIPMPNLPEMDVMFNVLGKLLEDVNLKNTDVATACASWQEKAEKLIEAMK